MDIFWVVLYIVICGLAFAAICTILFLWWSMRNIFKDEDDFNTNNHN